MRAYGYLALTINTDEVRRTVARPIETTDPAVVTRLLRATEPPGVPEGHRLCPDCLGQPLAFCDRCCGQGLLPR